MNGSRDPLNYGWWLASRSAGLVAFALLTAAVLIGLMMALRLAPKRARATIRVAHERLALTALAATGAHGLLLLPDPWLKPGLSGVMIPFASAYRPFWTGLGVLGGYMAAALSLTYYLRRRLGPRRWRNAHRLIPIAWALAAVHVLGAGTNGTQIWLELPVILTIALVLLMVALRVGRSRRAVASRPWTGSSRPGGAAAGRSITSASRSSTGSRAAVRISS